MHANPEIGVIQDTESIGKICREKGILFHVDSVASAGHIEVDVKKFNCDLLSLAGQNFYGPRGSAALYVKKVYIFLHFLMVVFRKTALEVVLKMCLLLWGWVKLHELQN